jgi:hypothetical protein
MNQLPVGDTVPETLGYGRRRAHVMVAASGIWDTGAVNATAWDQVEVAIGAAAYPATVLPADASVAEECLSLLEITTRSWLGAVVADTGGLVVDHGQRASAGPPLYCCILGSCVGSTYIAGQPCWTASGRSS